jgi:exodeoxyribonuclease VII large subunit
MSFAEPHVLTVDRLNAYLRALLDEDPIVSDVWVRGEVSNFHRSQAGHCYFSLGNDGSVLRCALFRNSQLGMLALPSNGDVVLAHGRVSVYEATGQYQLYVDNVAPEGTGLVQLQFEQLRKRLDEEGLFAVDRKRTLPTRPSAIGVVTSAQGAVWHDIRNVIARRYPLTRLVLAPSSVQGATAPAELIRSLGVLQQDPEIQVIIIGRGGGSAEDLACFNDESLARAIYASSVPVVSAVGHETDVSITDFVADVRAPTPSAAAELCVPDRVDLVNAIVRSRATAGEKIQSSINRSRYDVEILSGMISHYRPVGQIQTHRQFIDTQTEHAQSLLQRRVGDMRSAVTSYGRTAALLDPRDVLRRGYAIVSTDLNGIETRLPTAVAAMTKDRIRLTFSDGSLVARVHREIK